MSSARIKVSFKEGRLKSNLVLIVLDKVEDCCKPGVCAVQDTRYFSG